MQRSNLGFQESIMGHSIKNMVIHFLHIPLVIAHSKQCDPLSKCHKTLNLAWLGNDAGRLKNVHSYKYFQTWLEMFQQF